MSPEDRIRMWADEIDTRTAMIRATLMHWEMRQPAPETQSVPTISEFVLHHDGSAHGTAALPCASEMDEPKSRPAA